MGIGREVADAYISVHGDLTPFRKKLNDANKTMADWAEENADSITEAWGKRMESEWARQWHSIADAMYSSDPVDFNRMITAFDPADMDNAVEKIEKMLSTMEQLGKIDPGQHNDMIISIMKEVEAIESATRAEENLARTRERNADHITALFEDNRRNMEEAIRENEKWARSFDGINKNANLAKMESDFRDVASAMRTADFSTFAKGFKDFPEMRRRINEITAAMQEQGRVSREQAFIISDSANLYISAEEDKARATREALDAARLAREEQERYTKSIRGMVKAAKDMDLEQRFRGISMALATGDWSKIARAAKDMDDLREKALAAGDEMVRTGRASVGDFVRLSATLDDVAADMDKYNVSFASANEKSERHKRDWSVIHTMIGNAAKKFAGFTGLNILSDMFREGADFFQNLDRNAVKIGKMTLLIGTAAASIIHAVGGLAVMGQDLAAIGNIGILAPGFLTAAGIGIGVLVAAFKDMGDVLADLGPRFGALQDMISAKFWAQAEGPIRNLVDGLFPTLNTQLGNTATGMGNLTAAFANAFAGAAAPDRVTGMFEKMNTAIDILAGAMDPLVQAFVTMGEIGSQYFERFATWLVELSTRFNNFIQAAAADGRLNAWIETAITNLQAVGSILGSTVGIWNAIGDAAEGAGIGGLAAFASSLERAAAVMNSREFQSTLMILFIGAADAARSVGDAIIGLGPALESIMPTISLALVSIGDTMATVIGYIGQIMSNPAVQQGITDFVNGISTGIAALAPAIGPLGDSLGQVGTLLGQVAAQLGPLIAAFVTGLAPVLDQVTAAFARITFAAGPVILDLINQLAPVFQNLVDTILPPLENLIMTVLPLLGPAFAAITPIIDALMPIFGNIVTAIGQLVEMIAPYLVPAIEKISAAVTPVIEVLGQVVQFILSVLVPILGFLLIGVINNVVGVFQGLSNFIMGFVEIVTAIFTGFGAFFTKLFEGDIGGALGALGTMFSQIWDGIVKMVSGALEAVWNFVQLLFIGKLIVGIKTGLASIVNFFKSSWDNIGGTVSGALNNIVAFINSGLNAAKTWVMNGLNGMLNFFRSGWDNMVSATSTGISNVITWVAGIPGRILSGLGNVGGILLNAGKAIIDGFLQGLKNAWGAVTSFVGGIADWIAKNKGPLPYDRQLLVPAGKAIMDGLGAGLESKLTMLKSVLDTVTATMEDSITDSFAKSRMFIAGADAALGLADGLKSRKSDVASALSAVMPANTSASLNLSGTAGPGVGTPTPGNSTTVIVEAGAIPVTTPTKDPELVASKVIDGFAGFSNF